MKKLNFKKVLGSLLIMVMGSFTVASCSDDDTNSTSDALVIESVSLTGYNVVDGENVAKDSLTTTGSIGNMYIIRGNGFLNTQKIYFNEVEATFNPTLITNTVIFVQIPENVPYSGNTTSNKLRIVTTTGSAEYDFMIGQPGPRITGFDPVAGGEGTIVTITGTLFDNLQAVRFDDIPATIISSTNTEIKVEVPAGIVQSYIFVETTGGITRSGGQFGFKFIVYDEVLAPGWWVGGWGGTQEFDNTEVVKRGTYAIKRTTDAWSGFQIGNGGATIDLANGYTAIKVSVQATTTGKILLVMNGNYDAGKTLDVTAGEWIDFTVPFSELGSPATLNEIVIQEFSGAGNVLYIDDLGLI